MNSIIETLNQSGGQFLNFAWPMLWQSSLLIAFVFALDFLLAHKIRASIRYALWLAVLVKLILPPTLALPTGAAWWLLHAQPADKTPIVRNYTVSYDTTPQMNFVPSTIPLAPPAPPKLNGAGWMFLSSGMVSAALLLWLAFRWWQVMQMVRRAVAVESFSAPVAEALRLAGAPFTGTANLKAQCQHAGPVAGAPMLLPPMRLKLVEDRMSPAVCGLFRPVILLPRTLAEQLSPTQLRAVLLHEMFHLRRKDVWVNCAQALLQIVYWWHPLLWIANARIRRVREEAVDDAVMLALREEADSYAPTLLEVAKLAFRRPLMSLGLVGIMESRSALRQRIERLVDFRAPSKAGLTFASLCGICVFSAVALPMGEAPSPAGKQTSPDVIATDPQPQLAMTFMLPHPERADILRSQLFEAGVKIPPTIIYDFENGILFGRGTTEQLILIQQVIFKLNGYPPQVVTAATNIPDYAVKIPAHEPATPQFFSRHFRVSNQATLERLILKNLPQTIPSSTASAAFIELFAKLGVNLKSPGKSVFYNEQRGELFVKTTASDLDMIECVVGAMVQLPVQNAGTNSMPVVAPHLKGVTGVLSDSNFNAVIHALEQRTGSNTLAEPEVVTTSGRGINKIAIPTISAPAAKMDAGSLVQDAKLLYEMGKLDDAETKLKAALALDPENAGANYYLGLVQTAQKSPQRILLQSKRQKIVNKLNQIHLEHHLDQFGPFVSVALGEVVRQLNESVRQNDPEKTGINISVLTNSFSSNQDIVSVLINMPVLLMNWTLPDALDAITKNASQPIKYSIMDDSVIFSAKDNLDLYSRHFHVDVKTFTAALRKTTGMKTESVSQMAKSYFNTVGVDLDLPGKSVFFGDWQGELFVRATEIDLDKITEAVEKLDSEAFAMQIHIKARFVEVPKGTLQGFKTRFTVIPQPGQTNQSAGLTGILTDENFRKLLSDLENQAGAESLAEPEVVTTGGRQTQMRATVIQTIITNFVFQETSTNSAVIPQAGSIETGPVLDVVPRVLSDGCTINLTLTPSLIDFLGYDQTTNTIPVHNSKGEEIDLPQVLPKFQVQQASANVNLWDNQTVVLGDFPNHNFVNGKEVIPGAEKIFKMTTKDRAVVQEKELLVFITATIVDPAGNRVHSGDDLPFAKAAIPSQPAAK